MCRRPSRLWTLASRIMLVGGVVGVVGLLPPSWPTVPIMRKTVKVTTMNRTRAPRKVLTVTSILLASGTATVEKLTLLTVSLTGGTTMLLIRVAMTPLNVVLTMMLIVRLTMPLCTVKAPNLPSTFTLRLFWLGYGGCCWRRTGCGYGGRSPVLGGLGVGLVVSCAFWCECGFGRRVGVGGWVGNVCLVGCFATDSLRDWALAPTSVGLAPYGGLIVTYWFCGFLGLGILLN